MTDPIPEPLRPAAPLEPEPPPGEIVENDVSRPGSAGQVQKAAAHMRKLQSWTLLGLGGLITISILAMCLVVLVRPELADLVGSMSQLLFGGLIGLGGTAVGYLFGRENSESES